MSADTARADTAVARQRWRFGWYWSSVAVTSTGSAVSAVVVPITAVTLLRATAGEIAVLSALSMVPSLLLQVLAGSVADRLATPVRFIVLADIAATILMAAIPVLWWTHQLTFTILLLVVGAKAVVGVFNYACTAPMIPALVPREDLVRANGRINGTRSAADMAGKALGGGLMAMAAPPVAVIADALSYLLSAGLISRVRLDSHDPSAAATGDSGPSAPVGTRALLARLLRRPDLWVLVPVSAANGLAETVLIIYCIRTLHIVSAVLGGLLSLGAVGGIVGGALAGRLAARFKARTMVIGVLAMSWSLIPLMLARPGWIAGAATVNYELAGALGGTIILSAAFGVIQSATEPGSMARTMGAAQNALQLSALLGIGIGGVVAQLASPRAALLCALAVIATAAVPLSMLLRNSGLPIPGTAHDSP